MQTTVIKKVLWLTFYSLPLLAFAARGTEPRAQVVFPQIAQSNSLPVKVTIYKSHRAQLASLPRIPGNPLKLQGGKPTTQEVKAFVQTQATEYGVNPKLALWIVKHESGFNPRARGDGEASRGLWQISRIYHPEVSDAMAFSVASSTEWSLERIRSGKVNEWSTYRFCRTLYEDCPF
jgi:Transglycosylase SLT domain